MTDFSSFNLEGNDEPESNSVSDPSQGASRTDAYAKVAARRTHGVSEQTYRRVVNAADMAYKVRVGHQIPTMLDIMAHCSVQPKIIMKVLASREFLSEMAKRGIRWTDNTKLSKDLTPEQVLVIGIITDPTNRRPMNDKLKQAGVSYAHYRNWLRNPVFAERVKVIGEQLLDDNMASIHTKLVEKGNSGDIQAIKLFYEVTGRHDPAKQQMVDLGRIVGLILEVLTRHVRDPETLKIVARDIDIIMAGDTPTAIRDIPDNYVPSSVVTSGELQPHHSEVETKKVLNKSKVEKAAQVLKDLGLEVPDGFYDFKTD